MGDWYDWDATFFNAAKMAVMNSDSEFGIFDKAWQYSLAWCHGHRPNWRTFLIEKITIANSARCAGAVPEEFCEFCEPYSVFIWAIEDGDGPAVDSALLEVCLTGLLIILHVTLC